MSSRSMLLVGLQMALIAALLLTGPLLARNAGWLGLELAGIGLGAWAVARIRLKHLRVAPELADGASLVTSGPYRWIRHPMYLAVLLAAAALVADAFTLPRLGLWLALAAVLATKAVHEEKLLAATFPDYGAYRQRTWRLVPLLW
jgi:protein-S-isoprenylcysteine O-methyltransferase Ste14